MQTCGEGRVHVVALPAQEGSARAVAFSPDSKILASAGRDGLVKRWDAQTRTLVAILEGHHGYIYSLAFVPDGKTLASFCIDSTIRLRNFAELLTPQADQEKPGK